MLKKFLLILKSELLSNISFYIIFFILLVTIFSFSDRLERLEKRDEFILNFLKNYVNFVERNCERKKTYLNTFKNGSKDI